MTRLCKDCKHYRGTALDRNSRYHVHYCLRAEHEQTDPITGDIYNVGALKAYEERDVYADNEDQTLRCGPEAKHWEPRTAEQLIEDKRRRDEYEEFNRVMDESRKRSKPGFWRSVLGINE